MGYEVITRFAASGLGLNIKARTVPAQGGSLGKPLSELLLRLPSPKEHLNVETKDRPRRQKKRSQIKIWDIGPYLTAI
jgi:hypothetical protein